ncbi:high-potential iron-sulfur protein [Sideroxydans sp. CL21]|uniref:high-potential iron-sulfur protein n=1 Tax=Sideroxydans sp. CL21 TaxID=2600596 RepID=UPI0024BCA4A0|nr:high-potential iron-sulfur protein [Sideroxydans sp. CL21]
MSVNRTRRNFLKTASLSFVLVPLVVFSRHAGATVNSDMRAQLKYQNSPKDNMNCTTCLEFIPGKTDKAMGRCKVIPEDDEISPDGYCTKWNTM